jgi:hypothetical protein
VAAVMVSDKKRGGRPSIRKLRSTGRWDIAIAVFLPPTRTRDLDDWLAPAREAAIAYITDKVRRSPKDRDKLAEAIFDAFIELRGQIDPSESRGAPKRLRKIQQILKAVRKCAAWIDSDPYISKRINKYVGLVLPPVHRLLFDLTIFENELIVLAERRRSKFPSDSRRPSELEWLAGVSLPLVYERNFGHPAGRSRGSTSGDPGGPTVRFVAATLEAVGVSYSNESIVRAMSRLAAFRDRAAGR